LEPEYSPKIGKGAVTLNPENDIGSFMDLSPNDERWGHAFAKDADELPLHYVRMANSKLENPPVVCLLHGWPGFWYDWRRTLPLLAEFSEVLAPDLRGFGESAKPAWPPSEAYSPQAQARNILALFDQLQLDTVIVVGYDVGGRVAQILTQFAPKRVRALVLGPTLYPGFGTRPLQPEAQRERWYQHFHTIAQADQIIGNNQETVRLYLSYFYEHWLGNKAALRPKEFEAIVQTYAQPGAVAGSIGWYRAGAGSGQVAAANVSQPPIPPIDQPTAVVWGELDPILPAEWTDQLGSFFSNLVDVQLLAGIGHFVPFEAPQAIVSAVQAVI